MSFRGLLVSHIAFCFCVSLPCSRMFFRKTSSFILLTVLSDADDAVRHDAITRLDDDRRRPRAGRGDGTHGDPTWRSSSGD